MIEDLDTYLFYTGLGALFILCLKYIVNTRVDLDGRLRIDFSKPGVYFFIFIYTIIVGLRYEVGVDYKLYTFWYHYFGSTNTFSVENELGFQWIIMLFNGLNLPSEFLFVAIALLQVTFMMKALDRLAFLKEWFFFYFFLCLIFFISMNGMRQTIAFFMFFWAYFFFLNREYKKYILIILLGVLFHKTILIPAIVGVFVRRDIFRHRIFLIGLLAVGSIILPLLLESFFELIFPVVDFFGYGFYIKAADSLSKFTEVNQTGDGLSFILFLLIDGIIIFYSGELKKRFKSNYFIPFYNLFVVGAILSRTFEGNFIFLRIAEYFINFRALILAFVCFYFAEKASFSGHNYIKFSILRSILIVGMLAFFYKGIINNAAGCRPWRFTTFEH